MIVWIQIVHVEGFNILSILFILIDLLWILCILKIFSKNWNIFFQ